MSTEASFGRWLKQLRTTHDLTQAALAQQAGCAPITLRQIEAGMRRPSRPLGTLSSYVAAFRGRAHALRAVGAHGPQ